LRRWTHSTQAARAASASCPPLTLPLPAADSCKCVPPTPLPPSSIPTHSASYMNPPNSLFLFQQVRKAASNAIFSWPSGSSTASNLYYNPSARISDYGNNYAPATISVGTASTAGNLANCAGALGTTSLAFAAASYVFWAETGASGGAAVLRSEYTTGFGGGVSLWAGSAAVSSFLAGTSVVAPSNDVVGVAYNPATVILFAATYGELYATSTPLASSGIVWYRLASASALTDTLGAARANNFRGVSLSPKNCAASSPQLPFRQLLEGRNSTAAVAAVGDEAPLIL
jgi:hypothetical protein